MICHLERGERRPSTVMAEILFDDYRMAPADARRLRAVALPGVGRDSPYAAAKRFGAQEGGTSSYW